MVREERARWSPVELQEGLEGAAGREQIRLARVAGGWWRCAGEELVQADPHQGGSVQFGSELWADCAFEFEVKRDGDREGFGALFRVKDQNTCSRFAFDDSVNLVLSNSLKPNPRQRTIRSPVRTQAGRWYKVRVELNGNRCRCLVDGQAVCDWLECPHPRGGVGVQSGSTVTRFRNFRVTAPDGTVLFEGLPRLPPAGIDLIP